MLFKDAVGAKKALSEADWKHARKSGLLVGAVAGRPRDRFRRSEWRDPARITPRQSEHEIELGRPPSAQPVMPGRRCGDSADASDWLRPAAMVSLFAQGTMVEHSGRVVACSAVSFGGGGGLGSLHLEHLHDGGESRTKAAARFAIYSACKCCEILNPTKTTACCPPPTGSMRVTPRALTQTDFLISKGFISPGLS